MEKITSKMLSDFLKSKGYNGIKGTFNESSSGCAIFLNSNKEPNESVCSFWKKQKDLYKIFIKKTDYFKIGLLIKQNKNEEAI